MSTATRSLSIVAFSIICLGLTTPTAHAQVTPQQIANAIQTRCDVLQAYDAFLMVLAVVEQVPAPTCEEMRSLALFLQQAIGMLHDANIILYARLHEYIDASMNPNNTPEQRQHYADLATATNQAIVEFEYMIDQLTFIAWGLWNCDLQSALGDIAILRNLRDVLQRECQ